jgi:hypothetical protein
VGFLGALFRFWPPFPFRPQMATPQALPGVNFSHKFFPLFFTYLKLLAQGIYL